MNQPNTEIKQQLSALADLCCQTLDGDHDQLDERAEPLLKSLLMSGYTRLEGASLRSDIETQVKDRCRDDSMHRGGALSAITDQLQQKFDDLARWESSQPDQADPPKAANISSRSNS